MKQGVIFCDCDGVLNTDGDFEIIHGLLMNLKKIVRTTDCRIVISSNWRHVPYMMLLLTTSLELEGMKVSDVTPYIRNPNWKEGSLIEADLRPNEIKAWLDKNDWEKEPFPIVILDGCDMDFKSLAPFLVLTRLGEGLCESKTTIAIELLREQIEKWQITTQQQEATISE